jgi:hypothetical protein
MGIPAHRNDTPAKGRKAAPAPVAPNRAISKSGLVEKLVNAAKDAEASQRFDLSELSRTERRKLLFGK